MACSGPNLQRSLDKCVPRAEGQRPEGARRTEYEEQIRDLELFIPKERKRRGHMDVVRYSQYFYVEREEGVCVS